MDGYSRAYRDSKSPLTPIAPLATNAFGFNSSTSKRNPSTEQKNLSSCSQRNDDHSSRRKCNLIPPARSSRSEQPSFHEFCSQNPRRVYSEIPTQRTPKSKMRSGQFKRSSPVATRCLSPRTSAFLSRSGLQTLKPVFQREEVNLDLLRQMTFEDMLELGVLSQMDQNLLSDAAQMARNFMEF